jgi:histidinol dehydrogenase
MGPSASTWLRVPASCSVVADEGAKPAHVAADLLCEAEHDEEAQVWLVTNLRIAAQGGRRSRRAPVEGAATGKDRAEIGGQIFRCIRCADDG